MNPSVEHKHVLNSVKPCVGTLIHLRTKAEVDSHVETIDAYICEVLVKNTSHTIAAIKKIPQHPKEHFPHLRRVVKTAFLPEWLTQHHSTSTSNNGAAEKAYILLCPASTLSKQDLEHILALHAPDYQSLYTHAVPRFPPKSPEQAVSQSRDLWPTTYNANSSYGPTPAEVTSAAGEIAPRAGLYIALARYVAQQARNSGQGESIGVVVVKHSDTQSKSEEQEIVCVAHDARYIERKSDSCKGDPAGHAVMRAIAFIAHRRVQLKEGTHPLSPSPELTPLEASFLYSPGNLDPGGYLALDLDFYVTHEPCIMCSMALVHSRVGRVVFCRRMRRTGGLVAETGAGPTSSDGSAGHVGAGGLGYGLFWRPELNWRFLCWEWKAQEDTDDHHDGVAEDIHA